MLPPRSASPTSSHRVDPDRDQILACSSGRLAFVLNLSGGGIGYVYQRRWRAYWLGGLAALTAALVLGLSGAVLGPRIDQRSPQGAGSLLGAIAGAGAGLLGVAVGSSLEAGLAVNRARRRLQG
ncbi:MAG: hypothetical protein VKJ44_00810 [Synechococcus sp.]|nr:hypothetical protein [Synechococcus sp.]